MQIINSVYYIDRADIIHIEYHSNFKLKRLYLHKIKMFYSKSLLQSITYSKVPPNSQVF